ncbi:hypothetical protein JXA85_01050 [Candidatus Woesearchaeota archaeon]|nr:hypothetical protein [Candidatus Woesearchaeota archaeon]
MNAMEKDFELVREELLSCQNPVFLFDDDPDGLCSFLLLYRFIREGHGIVVKSQPRVNMKFLHRTESYQPDKVFFLDMPMVEESLLNAIKVPTIWIDHHEPQNPSGVKYLNPRNHKAFMSTTEFCYNVVEDDLWIATVGAVADWTLPAYMDDFIEKYPSLISKKPKKPEDALFDDRFGILVKIFSFILKGETKEVMQNVKILTRIKSPDEILNQTTSQGRFIYKRFEKIDREYQDLYSKVQVSKDDELVIFTYSAKSNSYTHDIANRLLYENPDKFIIVGREKSGEVKMSLRSHRHVLPPIIAKALQGVEGYGGGHEHACGSCVKKEDFETFIKNIREQIRK